MLTPYRFLLRFYPTRLDHFQVWREPNNIVIPSQARDLGLCPHYQCCRRQQTPRPLAALGLTDCSGSLWDTATVKAASAICRVHPGACAEPIPVADNRSIP